MELQDFKDKVEANENLDGLFCAVICSKDMLTEEVPTNFPNRELNGIVRTWENYSCRTATDGNMAFMFVGNYDNGIYRIGTTRSEEIYRWIEIFGVESFMTSKEDIMALNDALNITEGI